MVGPANCSATRYGLGSGSKSTTMQLGLRVAAAKLPGPAEQPAGAGAPWSQAGAFVPRGDHRGFGGSPLRPPAAPLYNRTRQRGGVIAIYASRKPCVPPTPRCTGRLDSRPIRL